MADSNPFYLSKGNVATALLQKIGKADADNATIFFHPDALRVVPAILGNLKHKFVNRGLMIIAHGLPLFGQLGHIFAYTNIL